jgi:putative ABC transport system permease protein
MKAFPIRYRNTALKAVAVNGVVPNFTEVRNFEIAEGSPLSEDDEINQRKVAILGPTTAEKLFGKENPVGKTILIWRVPCQVIGVTAAKGTDLAGTDQDNQIFVPLKTFLRTFTNQAYLNSIYIQAAEQAAIPPLQSDVAALLRVRHKIADGQKDDFTVVDLKDVNALKNDAMGMIKILGRTAAGASFLIGALGILSIMILIVNERRVEIGIRRAVGSRKRDIILQFLLESSFISVTGGLIGIFAGILASLLIARILSYPATISTPGLLISFAVRHHRRDLPLGQSNPDKPRRYHPVIAVKRTSAVRAPLNSPAPGKFHVDFLQQESQLQKSLCVIPSKDGIQSFQYLLEPGLMFMKLRFMNIKLRFRRGDLNKLVLQLAQDKK